VLVLAGAALASVQHAANKKRAKVTLVRLSRLLFGCRGRGVAGFDVLRLLHRRLELLRSDQRTGLEFGEVARGPGKKLETLGGHVIGKFGDGHAVKLANTRNDVVGVQFDDSGGADARADLDALAALCTGVERRDRPEPSRRRDYSFSRRSCCFC
jgi:hypothetical protein